MPMHKKLRYVSKCNKLVQLVVQVQYHMNVIYSLGGGHTHTHACTRWNSHVVTATQGTHAQLTCIAQ